MKTILIPTEDHDAMPAVLEAATLMARAFDSYMEGFAVRPSAGTYVTVEPVSSLAISGAYDGEAPQARARHLRAVHAAAGRAGGGGRAGDGGLSYGWPMADGADDIFIGSYGRVFDLIVLGRPGRAPENPRMPPLEAALFESGKPVLIVPSAGAQGDGQERAGGLERQHRTGAHQCLRARAVAAGREGDRADGRRQLHAGPLRRGGRAPSAPQRHQGAGD